MERPLNFWEEEFGRETPLVKISRVRIEKVKLKLAREMSRSTVNRYLSVLKTAFNWFVLQGMFNVNRVRKIKFFRTNNEIVRYLDSVTEYPKLLDEATKIRWYLPHMIKLGVHTGLRKRNLLHLRWDQCDFKTRTIRIATETKNEEVIALPMNDTVLQTLREVKEITGHMNYVFSHLKGKDKGKPINDVKTAFHSACERAGIQDFRWHDLRHTFASWLVMKRVSLLAVQKLLGHKSMRMTLRYAHLAPDYLADEVRVLDDN